MKRIGALLLIALPSSCQQNPAPALNGSRSDQRYECDCRTTVDDLAPHPACLRRDADAYQMQPAVLRSLKLPHARSPFGAYSTCGMFWVRSDGRARQTLNYDNGADYFCNGLTRYYRAAKYGYMNAELEVVVPPDYDFAAPFRSGHGIVCQACTFSPSGEHTAVSCARCGAVNVKGQLVLALTFSMAQLEQRFPGDPDADCPESP